MITQILLDARKLGDGGIGVYIENLVDGLLELREHGRANIALHLLVTPHKGATINPALARWKSQVSVAGEPSGKYSLDECFGLARRHRRLLAIVDLFHSPHYTLPFFLGVPAVCTIHDTIHVTHPEKAWVAWTARCLIGSAAQRASAVICVSESGKSQLQRVVVKATEKISVVPNALSREIRLLPGARVESDSESYCLFVGTERKHKGFRELLDAWARLAATQAEFPTLLVVGERFSELSRGWVDKLGLSEKVRFLGAVSSTELSALYNRACAVVVPSHVEGFGLPALEAMACGAAVVCTPDPSLLETTGSCAWVAEDFTGEGIYKQLVSLLADPTERQRKIAFGLQRAEKFTRTKAAEETCRVYERVLRRDILAAEGLGRSESIGIAVGGT